jgi:hypothetical protein
MKTIRRSAVSAVLLFSADLTGFFQSVELTHGFVCEAGQASPAVRSQGTSPMVSPSKSLRRTVSVGMGISSPNGFKPYSFLIRPVWVIPLFVPIKNSSFPPPRITMSQVPPVVVSTIEPVQSEFTV